jgi:hypothetical protein
VASWTRKFFIGWAVAGASAMFDLFQASKHFTFEFEFVSFFGGDDTSVLTSADWIFNSDHLWTVWIFNWFWAAFTVVTTFVAFSVGWAQDRKFWLTGWARDWSWEGEAEVAQSVWITDLWPFRNSVIRQAFENSASISTVPNFVYSFWFTVVHAFFAFSGHATFTLDKSWSGTIFTEGIIEWMAKFWSAFTLVLVAAFVNSFRNWFVENLTSWDFWGGAVFTLNLNDFP